MTRVGISVYGQGGEAKWSGGVKRMGEGEGARKAKSRKRKRNLVGREGIEARLSGRGGDGVWVDVRVMEG